MMLAEGMTATFTTSLILLILPSFLIEPKGNRTLPLFRSCCKNSEPKQIYLSKVERFPCTLLLSPDIDVLTRDYHVALEGCHGHVGKASGWQLLDRQFKLYPSSFMAAP